MSKKKINVIILLLVVFFVIVAVMAYFWVANWIELSSVQDAVKKFLMYVEVGDTSKMKNLVGGKLFVNIYGSGIEGVEELKKMFPSDSQILFFRTYKPSELTSDEKRDYGFYAWKVNLVVVNERYQFVGGYSFFVSRITETSEDNSTRVRHKIVDIKNVGSIIF